MALGEMLYDDPFNSAGGYGGGGGGYPSRASTEILLDVNRYSEPDANPYVVGSAAYNAARGLAPPAPWIERTSTVGVDAPQVVPLVAAATPTGIVISHDAAPTTPGAAPPPPQGLPKGWLPIAIIVAAVVLSK